MEILGSYDPHQKAAVLKEDRIKYWLTQGVQASDSVHNLLVSKGVTTDKKRAVKLPKKEVPENSETKEEVKTEEVKLESKTEEAKAEEAKVEEKVEEKKEEKKEETKSE